MLFSPAMIIRTFQYSERLLFRRHPALLPFRLPVYCGFVPLVSLASAAMISIIVACKSIPVMQFNHGKPVKLLTSLDGRSDMWNGGIAHAHNVFKHLRQESICGQRPSLWCQSRHLLYAPHLHTAACAQPMHADMCP